MKINNVFVSQKNIIYKTVRIQIVSFLEFFYK